MYAFFFPPPLPPTQLTLSQVHAVSTENRKRGPIEVGWAIDNIAIEVCSACGDPHFTGLDGIPYDYQGTPLGLK